jgi:type I restriction enzyme S subunit
MSFSEWREVKLEDIIEIEMGQSPKSEFYNQTGEGLPFLQGNRTFGDKYPYFDTYCTENKKIANKNDVIMSVRAPVGDLNIAQTQISLGRGVCAMRLKGEQNSNYLFYLMKHNIKEMINRESGTVFGSVNKKDILGLDVKITNNKLEQKAIAHILSTLDDKIEVNNQINKTLENIAQTIFKQWFVDFEFPNGAGEPYKSSGGEMVESELGMIPKGWEVNKANNIASIGIGKTPPRKEKECFTNDKNDKKWISIKDLGNSGTYIFDSSEYLTKESIEKYNIKIVPQNTVVLSFKLTIGRVAITSEEMATNEAIAHFKLDEKSKINTEYLYLYLKKFDYEKLGNTSSIATAVNSKIIKDMPIIVPDKKVLEQFNVLINCIFKDIKNTINQTNILIQLRDSLLPKLMSGEIRVPIEEN